MKSLTLREQYEATRNAETRFVNKATGELLPSNAEVRNLYESRLTDAEREENSRGRETLNDLESAARAFTERITDREYSVTKLTPSVADAVRKLERAKEDLSHAQEAEREHIIGARVERIRAEIKLKWAEDQLSAISQRLDISTKVLAAAKQLYAEWTKLNGDKLAKLRRLSTGLRHGDKF